ncbi:transcription factor S [Nanoarchaeota archaeon]
MFCPKCGSILLPKKDDKGKPISTCSCGYSANAEKKSLKEEGKKEEVAEVEVVDKEIETLPLSEDETCPKCGNKGAYYWLIQTRSGDEAETKFMKCSKCKHIWRDYS